ncbi:MAG: hypothetical protein WDO56_24290 [Gammaproteobacteria bacterium]
MRASTMNALWAALLVSPVWAAAAALPPVSIRDTLDFTRIEDVVMAPEVQLLDERP